MPQDPVLIVGAGITGLVLGQALKQRNIPFKIYERDPSLTSRHQGWAITLHWALQYLPSLLPEETLTAIENVQVDREVAKHDTGNFLFIDLSTGDIKWRIPPNKRWRVNREKLRRALLTGIEDNVCWGARAEDVNLEGDSGGKPRLILSSDQNDHDKDKTQTPPGTILVGGEGPRSQVRRFLCPDTYLNARLPVRFTGVAVVLTQSEISPLRALDPLLFQGCHPETGVFFWFSMLDVLSPDTDLHPETETETEKEKELRFKVQLGLSWHVHGPDDEVPTTNEDRLANMKRRATGFVPFLHDTIQRIPPGTEVVEVTLADWECPVWDNRGGRVTLAGDAAHAMT
ncbi:hypothetical protein BJX76DRAFT_360080, partial [Aspergillus varians]